MSSRSCVAIIEQGNILMILQSYKGKTFWTFPGGSIEEGDTAVEAAIREAREETGLNVKILDQVYKGYSPKIKGMYTCFLAERISGKVQLGHDTDEQNHSELHHIKWFPLEEVEDHHEVQRVLTFIKNRTGGKGR